MQKVYPRLERGVSKARAIKRGHSSTQKEYPLLERGVSKVRTIKRGHSST